MWETIELREIRVFLALAQVLHFGRAAEQLGVTQSRVSQSLRELEAKLGERLVDRTSRRVTLTAAGERFLAEVDPAHQRLSAVLKSASHDGSEIEGGPPYRPAHRHLRGTAADRADQGVRGATPPAAASR